MKPNLKICPDSNAVAATFAKDFSDLVQNTLTGQQKVTVALSGGSTPKILFKLWASEYAERIDWNRIHFFWGDERCVPPEDSESNYGVANELCFSKVNIDEGNVHRVQGEADPEHERSRYENEIYDYFEIADNENNDKPVPKFDLIILGMGADGHTASIFPNQMRLMESDRVCEVATHPESGQKRITLSGSVLNNAGKVALLVTGSNKASVLGEVINETGGYDQYPVSHLTASDIVLYADEAATAEL